MTAGLFKKPISYHRSGLKRISQLNTNQQRKQSPEKKEDQRREKKLYSNDLVITGKNIGADKPFGMLMMMCIFEFNSWYTRGHGESSLSHHSLTDRPISGVSNDIAYDAKNFISPWNPVHYPGSRYFCSVSRNHSLNPSAV